MKTPDAQKARAAQHDVRRELSLVHRRVLRFVPITTEGVLCVDRRSPGAARGLLRWQLRQVLLTALYEPALGCRLNGRAGLGEHRTVHGSRAPVAAR
jgi:hypothetical protein